MPRRLRLAVAQTTVPQDPGDVDALRAAGEQVRELLRRAAADGARLVQFPEGALVYPSKHVMSTGAPGEVTDADWSRARFDVLRAEARAVAALAGELGVWVAFGAPHELTPPHRPHNSLYVVDGTGAVAARYDKRFLSATEVGHLYTPGREPVVVTVAGFRVGLALCIEAHFPELFAEYERLDVDAVLLSVMVDDPVRAVVAQAYAALFDYWVGWSAPAQHAAGAPAGVVAPGGRWLARCPATDRPDLVVVDLDRGSADADVRVALDLARPWRRHARDAGYAHAFVAGDPRSDDRTVF